MELFREVTLRVFNLLGYFSRVAGLDFFSARLRLPGTSIDAVHEWKRHHQLLYEWLEDLNGRPMLQLLLIWTCILLFVRGSTLWYGMVVHHIIEWTTWSSPLIAAALYGYLIITVPLLLALLSLLMGDDP